MNPPPLTFAEQLRPLVDRIGTNTAAKLCGVTPRSLQRWLLGQGNPNAATQRGTLEILREVKPPKKPKET